MVEIIDFKQKLKDLPKSSATEALLQVLEDLDSIKDIAIFVKDKEANSTLFYSDTLSLEDKSLFVQLLQHDIFSEFSTTEDIYITPEE